METDIRYTQDTNNKRNLWCRSDKLFHKMTRNALYKRAIIKAQEVESDELVRKY